MVSPLTQSGDLLSRLVLPSSAGLPSVSVYALYFPPSATLKLVGLGAVPHAASGEFLGEGEDSLMFIVRGREAYL